MKILFVDDSVNEFKRFLDLPFAKQLNPGEIVHITSPVGLTKIVADNPTLRLIVLDMLWEQLELGADAARELLEAAPEVPVVIYSVMDDEERLRTIIPEMIRIGAYDWVSKEEPKIVRSFRFERAFIEGRNQVKIPESRAILAQGQTVRSSVPVAIMFADMSTFTALTNEIGGTNVVDVLRQFYKLVGRFVQKNGGYIDKYIGDEVMAVFGAKGTMAAPTIDYKRNCIEAALSIQAHAPAFKLETVDPVLKKYFHQMADEKLANVGKIRIGLESGVIDIARFERGNESEVTFIGTPVNIASRILAQSMPGDIWAGKNIHTEISAVAITETREVEYKNLPGKFEAYRLRT